jgi:hypothetical protein
MFVQRNANSYLHIQKPTASHLYLSHTAYLQNRITYVKSQFILLCDLLLLQK